MGNNSVSDTNGQIQRFAAENGFTVIQIQQRGDGLLVEFLNAAEERIGYIHPDAIETNRIIAAKHEFKRAEGPACFFFMTAEGELRFSGADNKSYRVELSDPQS